MLVVGICFVLLGNVAYRADAQECDPQCFPGHGTCSNGLCFCNPQWSGDDCSIAIANHVSQPAAPAPTTQQHPQTGGGPSRVMSGVEGSPQVLVQQLQVPQKFLGSATQGSELMSSPGFMNPMGDTRPTPALLSNALSDTPFFSPPGSSGRLPQEVPMSRAPVPKMFARAVTPHIGEAVSTAPIISSGDDGNFVVRRMAQQLQADEEEIRKLRSAVQGLNAIPSDDFKYQNNWLASPHMFVNQLSAREVVTTTGPLHYPIPALPGAATLTTTGDPLAMENYHPIWDNVTAGCIGVPIGVELLLFVMCAVMAAVDGCLKSVHKLNPDDPDYQLKRRLRERWGWNPCMCTKMCCSPKYGCNWCTILLLVIFALFANGGWVFLCTTPMMHVLLFEVGLIIYVSIIIMSILIIIFHEVWYRYISPAKTKVEEMIESNMAVIRSMNVAMGGKIKKGLKKIGHVDEKARSHLHKGLDKAEKFLKIGRRERYMDKLEKRLEEDDEELEEEEPSCWDRCRGPRGTREPTTKPYEESASSDSDDDVTDAKRRSCN